MARFYSHSGVQELTFARAKARNLTWDVFVSHTTRDDSVAATVAECLRRHRLTAWLDSDYFLPSDDGPGMASQISDIIKRSFCLLAIVTNATSSSWWVPFEIGVASTNHRFLSTYGVSEQPLPSFLAAWPRVKRYDALPSWCDAIRQRLFKYPPSTGSYGLTLQFLHYANYHDEMRLLAKSFPAQR